jgi:hypothetical protein
VLACAFSASEVSLSLGETDDDVLVAKSLAAMLRAGRMVVSRHQVEIDDPNVGDKGFTGAKLVAEAAVIYEKATGNDPNAIDPSTRLGRLLRAQMEAMSEVVDANQTTINQKGVGFKGFIAANFARWVNDAFSRRVGSEADLKVTAPPNLVRNLKAEPDAWEKEIISEEFMSPDWPKGKEYSAIADKGGRSAFRLASPEYYGASCLSCHGLPKGDIDVTGYPKEGAALGDLGGVISVSLYR